MRGFLCFCWELREGNEGLCTVYRVFFNRVLRSEKNLIICLNLLEISCLE